MLVTRESVVVSPGLNTCCWLERFQLSWLVVPEDAMNIKNMSGLAQKRPNEKMSCEKDIGKFFNSGLYALFLLS